MARIPGSTATDRPWQVGDSSAGLNEKDFNTITAKATDQRSGAEVSALDDSEQVDDDSFEVGLSGAETQHTAVHVPEDVGYDAEAFDENMDEADEPDPTSDEAAPPKPEEKSFFQKVKDALIPSADANEQVPNRAPAAVEESPDGAKSIKALREGGYPEEDIRTWRAQREKLLIDSGFPADDVGAYFGDKPHDHEPVAKFVEAETKKWFAPMALPPDGKADPKKEAEHKQAQGFWESLIAGVQGSAPGLGVRGQLPSKELSANPSTLEVLGQGAGQVAAELPMQLMAGAMGGAAATAAAGGVAAVAAAPLAVGTAVTAAGLFAAGAIPAGYRKFYADQIQSGNVKDAADFANRTMGVIHAMVSEGVLNVLTLGAGNAGAKLGAGVASKTISAALSKAGSLAAEMGVMGAGPALLEARLPKKEEFINAATMVAGFNVVHGALDVGGKANLQRKLDKAADPIKAHLENKLWNVYKETGLTAPEVVTMMEGNSTLHAEIMSDSMALPKSLEKYHPDYVEPAKPATSDYVQLDLGAPEQGELGISGREPLPTEKKVIDLPLPEELGGGSTQLEMNIPGGEVQPELGIPYSQGATPEPFNPTISAETGPYTPFVEPKDGVTIKDRYANISEADLKAMSVETAAKHIDQLMADPVKRDSLMKQIMKDFERNYLDRTAPLDRFMRKITGAKSDKELVAAFKASENPTVLVATHRGIVGKAKQFFEFGTFGFKDLQTNGASLKEVLAPLDGNHESAKNFQRFAMAARSLDYAKMGKNYGLDPVAARKIYDEFKGSEIGKIHRDFVEYNNRVLEYFKDSGMLSSEQFAAVKASGENYITTYRVIDGEKNNFGGGNTLQPKGLKKTTGVGETAHKVQNVFESTMTHTMELIEQAERNRLAKATYDAIQSKAPDFMKIVDVENGKTTVSEDGTTHTEYRPLKAGEVGVYIDGKRTIFEVPEGVATAMKSFEGPTFSVFEAGAIAAARALRAGATLTPDFILRNGFKDQIHAAISAPVNFDNIYIPWYSFARGMMHELGHTEMFERFQRGGGLNATKTSIDLNYLQDSVAKINKETGYLKTAINVVKDPLTMTQAGLEGLAAKNKGELAVSAIKAPVDVVLAPFKAALHVLREVSEAVEGATRLGQFESKYNLEKKRGTTDADAQLLAAYSARNVTLDFQRMGVKMQAMNAMIPFLNARWQGVSQFKKSFENDPVKAAAAAGVMGMASWMLWAANKDDPRMDEIPDWQKANFWIVPLDDWQKALPGEENGPLSRLNAEGQWETNRGKVLRIPMLQEWGTFGVLTSSFASAMDKHDPEQMGAFKESVLNLQPIPNLPLAVNVFKDFQSNYNSFSNRSIIPYGKEKLMSQLQYGPYTTPAAKLLSQKMYEAGLPDAFIPAPAKTDFLVQSLFGGTGRDAAGVLSYSLEKMGYAAPNLAAKDWDSLPFVKAFTIRVPEQAKSTTEFFEAVRDVNAVALSLKQLEKTGDEVGYERLAQDSRSQVAETMKGEAKETSHAMKEIKDAVEQIHIVPEDTVMSKDEKIKMVDSLLNQRMALAQQFLKNKREAEKQFQKKK